MPALLYYGLDLSIGYGVFVAVLVLHRLDRLPERVWGWFWLGCAIGLLWEIPIFVFSAEPFGPATIQWLEPLPLPYPVFLLCHTFWDGGLFLAGIALVHLIGPRPVFERFSWRELGVFVLWGQLSELGVETSSIASGCWVYLDTHAWNPPLFYMKGSPVPLGMQVVWFVAPVVFYFVVVQARGAPGRSSRPTLPIARST